MLLNDLVDLESYCEPFDEKVADVFFVEIFELDDKCLKNPGALSGAGCIVSKWDDDSFQSIIFVCPAFDASQIVFGCSVAIRTDFWMGMEFFFAGFAEVCSGGGAVDAMPGEEKIYDF
ncbi:TPA: hypothetical protein DCZ39_07495 [Patescibacteria group bacterium]|nr:hypothetical protein [Candidatus Gracilibacteria bacterium]